MKATFRLFLLAYGTSLIGTSMMPVVLTFAILNHGGSGADVGLVLAAETVPVILFLILGGVFADRMSRQTLMISADLLRGAVEIALALLFFSGHFGIALVVAAQLAIGLGNALFAPSFEGLIPHLIEGHDLQRANAYVSTVTSLGGVVGPAIGGWLAGTLSAGWAVTLDAGTYAISAICLAGMRVRITNAEQNGSAWGELVVGWREFRARRWLQLKVAQSACLNLLVIGPLWVLGPVLLSSMRQGGANWGLLLSTMSLGEVFGALVAVRLSPAYPLRAALLCFLPFCLAPLSLGLSWKLTLSACSFFVAGVSLASFSVLWATVMQKTIPPQLLSRMSAFDGLCSLSLLPIGYVLAAPLQRALQVNGALLFACAVSAISTLAVLSSRGIRTFELSCCRSGGHAP